MATAQAQQQGPYAYGSGARNVTVTESGRRDPRPKRVVSDPRLDTRSYVRKKTRPEQLVGQRVAEDVQRVRNERIGRVQPQAAAAAAQSAPVFDPGLYYEEETGDTTVSRTAGAISQISLLMRARVSSTSLAILVTTLPFWFIQLKLFMIGIAGLGLEIMNESGIAVATVDTNTSQGQSLLANMIDGLTGFISSVFGSIVSFFIPDGLGSSIYMATSLFIIMIGVCSIFYAFMFYSLRGVNPVKGSGIFFLLVAIGIYFVPILQLFPGVLLFVASVWWSHRKA